jgi:hypothetical protein
MHVVNTGTSKYSTVQQIPPIKIKDITSNVPDIFKQGRMLNKGSVECK